ncbi:MAG: hypothetical protein A3C12_02605 [Candidatus Sungbacteria bacterium RIFCSPHIGHO2_02_FULL_49_20]|uniref:Uncharacterized protein n=1 Tax=Candidatus Sungbacteria bacterium RIFCSPHIGHO2_02_FULL_49_20 TaxID=1802272 RepID=A0A1G2KUB3_9BACT|nr:MAG: hypothetical protein A3C12_02605 [Candidatus Sungbacteria bacterium RIFCSPHIGHO2_02_FULL_49_20]
MAPESEFQTKDQLFDGTREARPTLWGVLPVKIFGQCGGASMRTRFCQNYFLGKRISQNLGWLLFLYFVRAEKGLGRNAGGFALLKSCLGKRISQNLGWLLFLYFVRAEKGLGRNAGGFALLKSCLRKRIMLQYKYLKFQFYG